MRTISWWPRCTPSKEPIVSQLSGGNPTEDAFVVKLNSSGGVAYKTIVGGAGWDRGNGITVNSLSEPYEDRPMRDVLDRLESLRLLPSAERWEEIRAARNTLVPALFGTGAVLASIPVYFLGMHVMGTSGIAAAVSLSGILQVAVLYHLWSRRSGNSVAGCSSICGVRWRSGV